MSSNKLRGGDSRSQKYSGETYPLVIKGFLIFVLMANDDWLYNSLNRDYYIYNNCIYDNYNWNNHNKSLIIIIMIRHIRFVSHCLTKTAFLLSSADYFRRVFSKLLIFCTSLEK